MVARLRRIRRMLSSPLVPMVAIALLLGAGPTAALPLVGYVEHWSGTSLHGWSGGDIYSNPGTGGALGAGDGYLVMSLPSPGHLGAFCVNSDYTGNWIAAGVDKVRFWINDVNAAQSLEMHFAIGNDLNFWQYNPGFVPPFHAWVQVTVDLTNPANWTRIIGTGTFGDALSNVSKILIRHDRAPFQQSPDLAAGDVGIDELLLTNDAVPVLATTWSRMKALYR